MRLSASLAYLRSSDSGGSAACYAQGAARLLTFAALRQVIWLRTIGVLPTAIVEQEDARGSGAVSGRTPTMLRFACPKCRTVVEAAEQSARWGGCLSRMRAAVKGAAATAEQDPARESAAPANCLSLAAPPQVLPPIRRPATRSVAQARADHPKHSNQTYPPPGLRLLGRNQYLRRVRPHPRHHGDAVGSPGQPRIRSRLGLVGRGNGRVQRGLSDTPTEGLLPIHDRIGRLRISPLCCHHGVRRGMESESCGNDTGDGQGTGARGLTLAHKVVWNLRNEVNLNALKKRR